MCRDLFPSLQRRWFRCWRPSAWRKAKNFRRRWFYLLWAVETERNYHWGKVSNAIDAFQLALQEKRSQYEQRHGKVILQHDNARLIEKWLDSWIVSKDEHFYRNGIRALPERWVKVVANDGQYFEWFICNHFSTMKLHFHQKNSGNLVPHLI